MAKWRIYIVMKGGLKQYVKDGMGHLLTSDKKESFCFFSRETADEVLCRAVRYSAYIPIKAGVTKYEH